MNKFIIALFALIVYVGILQFVNVNTTDAVIKVFTLFGAFVAGWAACYVIGCLLGDITPGNSEQEDD